MLSEASQHYRVHSQRLHAPCTNPTPGQKNPCWDGCLSNGRAVVGNSRRVATNCIKGRTIRGGKGRANARIVEPVRKYGPKTPNCLLPHRQLFFFPLAKLV